ncbi:MAG TPA: 50S ribosomal protein L11 methyltransferase [Pseudomonadales bacterium]|nr:50S ribosomal protein L11 methyltransferase [Pseudomonadales bacterium]
MKTSKPLWKISVATTLEAEDAIAEILGEIFHCPVSSFFNLEKKTNRVTVFLSNKIPPKNLLELRHGLNRIKECGLDVGPGKISITKVRREDWAESWKRHFKPIEIRGSLLVKPSWSKKKPRAGQAVVILDPGLSFGTGQHPTTAYCLNEVARYSGIKRQRDDSEKEDPSFLDIGTGSSILAIAAAKLGYTRIRAFDFDPEAVRVARANARVNGVLKKIRIAHSDAARLPIKPVERFDVICANLISDLLVRERKRITAQLNPGGVLVLAGILKTEFSEVRQAYEKLGLKLISTKSKKEWQSGSFSFE